MAACLVWLWIFSEMYWELVKSVAIADILAELCRVWVGGSMLELARKGRPIFLI